MDPGQQLSDTKLGGVTHFMGQILISKWPIFAVGTRDEKLEIGSQTKVL